MANTAAPAKSGANTSLLIRGAIWIAIGALIAAALVCVVWVLIGDQQGLIGRAFLTILLLAGFAVIAILEAGLAPNRPDWLALLSMISWIVALLVGAVKIWLPDDSSLGGVERFFQLVLVVGILQLAMLHLRLFQKAAARHVTTFTRTIAWATYAFLAVLVVMLVFYLTFPHTFDYVELYWRIVVAVTILAAVGTMLIPLLNALFAPKPSAAQASYAGAVVGSPAPLQAWPTYADGRTPLPILADASPDWNAYYSGVPSPGATIPAPPAAAQPTVPPLPAQSATEAALSQLGVGAPAYSAPVAPVASAQPAVAAQVAAPVASAQPLASAQAPVEVVAEPSTSGGHGLSGALNSEARAGGVGADAPAESASAAAAPTAEADEAPSSNVAPPAFPSAPPAAAAPPTAP